MPKRSDAVGQEPTSPSLLSRAKASDQLAWQQLVRLYGPLVYEWCRGFEVSAEDALDVGQDVFQAVAAKLPDFRRNRPGQSFRGWLWTITHNKIVDYFRKQEHHTPGQGGSEAMALLAQIPDRPPATSDPDSRHHHQPGLSRRAMEWGRASVEPRTWAAFWQVAVDGRAPAAVAFDLGMSLRAVYEANFRVRRGIRQELTEVLD